MNEQNDAITRQYLTFKLANELFAVDVGKTREVLDRIETTSLPQAPDYMLGVINLRGAVVPVINLHQKFGMPECDETIDSCIIVMEVKTDGDLVVVGLRADAVQAVLDLRDDQIEPPPKLGTSLNSAFIEGMGNIDDQLLIILDIDQVFNSDEIADISGESDVQQAVNGN